MEAVMREGAAAREKRCDAFVLRVTGVVASAAIAPARAGAADVDADSARGRPPPLQMLATARDVTLHLAPFGERVDVLGDAAVPLVFKSPWGLVADRDAFVLWATARDPGRAGGGAGAEARGDDGCAFSVLLRLQQITTRVLVESADVEESWPARLAAIFSYTDHLTRTIEQAAAAAYPADVEGAVAAASLAAVAQPAQRSEGAVAQQTKVVVEVLDGALDHPPCAGPGGARHGARAICAFRRLSLACVLDPAVDDAVALALECSDLELYFIDVEPATERMPPHLRRSGPSALRFATDANRSGGEGGGAFTHGGAAAPPPPPPAATPRLFSSELLRLGFVRVATLDETRLRVVLRLVPNEESLEPFDPVSTVDRVEVEIDGTRLEVWACADVLVALVELARHTSAVFASDEATETAPAVLVQDFSGAADGAAEGAAGRSGASASATARGGGILSQIDEHAFDALEVKVRAAADFSFDDDAVLFDDDFGRTPSTANMRPLAAPGEFSFTVTFYANLAHSLTRSP